MRQTRSLKNREDKVLAQHLVSIFKKKGERGKAAWCVTYEIPQCSETWYFQLLATFHDLGIAGIVGRDEHNFEVK